MSTTMEAMTIMGMAASQARFLGLTARKSNVEYQGQQINQQRTALANESSNLYSQMMELTVPTPPSTSDYYETEYVLDGSSDSYAASDYKITNATKTLEKEGEYRVTLTSQSENVASTSATYKLNDVVFKDDTYTIVFVDKNVSDSFIKLNYNENDTNAYTGENHSLNVNNYQIYKVSNTTIDGYDQCCDPSKEYYFYKDAKSQNHFISAEDLEKILSNDEEESSSKEDEYYNINYMYKFYKDISTEVVATLSKGKSGRFSEIVIGGSDVNPNCPTNLCDRIFSISTVQVMNEDKYNDAYNDYEYEKYLYEKSISDINAKTEIIQQEDQQLELRLKQLDTEQNAIKTETEAVQKVIEDNIEKTFKIFA